MTLAVQPPSSSAPTLGTSSSATTLTLHLPPATLEKLREAAGEARCSPEEIATRLLVAKLAFPLEGEFLVPDDEVELILAEIDAYRAEQADAAQKSAT